MSSPIRGWRPPLCDSRTGAAHLRRAAPCQDASGVWSFVDPGRQAVQLLVVSDGHGGSRYDRSEVGSRLACRVAMQTARELLCSSSATGASLEDWRRWLARDLPTRLVESWRRQVLEHAGAHPRSDGAAISTIPYGATLGLLLLTPRWWGYTGLGDWDLVRLDPDGQGELVSEEPDNHGGAEATYSLCMEGAERFFEPRSGVQALAADSPPFSLLLSSDGIRKSCGTDADFLTLAHYLCGLPPARQNRQGSELSGALDHISSQGSGDDVSAAIARWGPLSDSERRTRSPRTSPPRIVQPKLEPWAGPHDVAPAQLLGPGGGPVPAGDPAAGFAAAPSPHRRRATPWLLGLAGGLLLAGACVGVAAVLGLGPFARREPVPFSPEQLAVVASEANRLCNVAVAPGHQEMASSDLAGGVRDAAPSAAESSAQQEGAVPSIQGVDLPTHGGPDASSPGSAGHSPAANGDSPPAREDGSSVARAQRKGGEGAAGRLDPERLASIRAQLNAYKSTFNRLRSGLRTPESFLARPADDHLGTLIAWSARQPGLGPLAEPVAASRRPSWMPEVLAAWLPDWSAPARPDPAQQAALPGCPELKEALRQQWQAGGVQAARPSAVPRPSAPPQPTRLGSSTERHTPSLPGTTSRPIPPAATRSPSR